MIFLSVSAVQKTINLNSNKFYRSAKINFSVTFVGATCSMNEIKTFLVSFWLKVFAQSFAFLFEIL